MWHAQTQRAFAAALFDPAAAPAGVTTARGKPDPARFAIYRNNVFVALIKPLETRFPVVRQLVGDDFFRAMARQFVLASKPASPLIMQYGDEFPAFIRNYPAAATLPYLADVAVLEAAWTRAYHAADAAPLELSSLAAIAVEDLLASPLNAHPAAALISSQFPIGSIWAAHQAAAVSPVTDWKPETVLIARPAYDVVLHVVPAGDAEFADAVLDGIAPGPAAEMVLLHNPDFDFGAALTGMISLGAFAGRTEGL